MSGAPTSEIPALTEPIPVLAERPRGRDLFLALQISNYRLYAISQIFANTGGWMQRVAVDWLVLELTGNVALVGLTVALQFAPNLLLAPWAGVLSDRVDRRRILMLTQSAAFLVNALLAALVLLGVAQAWMVFVIAGVQGAILAIDGPSRAAFIGQLVGTRRLANAISLNAVIFHGGGLVGPALSGVLIALIGSGWSIGINAIASLVAVSAFLAMRRGDIVPTPRLPRARGQIRSAIGYARRKTTIFWPLVLCAVVGTFGMNLPVLLTASANETYGTGSAGYGLYSSLAAAGALLGALLSARRRTLRLRTAVGWTFVYGLVTVVAGVTPWAVLFLPALVGIGLTRVTYAVANDAMWQLSSNPGIRGRIASLQFGIVVGGQALGGLVVGAIVETFGPVVGFVVAGGVPAIAAVAIALHLARRHQLRLRVDRRSPRRFVTIVRRTEPIALAPLTAPTPIPVPPATAPITLED
ncbi:MAG: MFS transporter [Actinomycetales bacterium]|nr:MFS transporter [Actinomycetales bacterium]